MIDKVLMNSENIYWGHVEDRNPNFVMLDFVNVGQGMEAVN
jgi:hypothetical protein